MRIPFDAIRTFVDPSVEFGLRFERTGDARDDPAQDEPPGPTKGDGHAHDAEVVRLDTFRKNH